MKINGVPKLLSFLSKFVQALSFRNSHHYQKPILSPMFTYPTNPSFILVMFLALGFLIIPIIMGSFLKPSSDDCDQDSQQSSIPFLSILESYPLSYIVNEDILDETYSFADIVNYKDDQEVIAGVVHLELEGAMGNNDQEFIPSIVHLELIEGAIRSHEDYKDFVSSFDQGEVIEGSIGSDEGIKEFDGYEGDIDDIESIKEGDDDDDDDLKIRVEEFIAKHIRKWKEEKLNDKFLCLEY